MRDASIWLRKEQEGSSRIVRLSEFTGDKGHQLLPLDVL